MSDMTLGACLVANEPDGQTKAILDARIAGKSWKVIADEFGYKTPSAARTAFQNLTGIADFKIKGPALKELFDQSSGLDDLAKKLVASDAPSAASLKKLKALAKDKGINFGDVSGLSKKEVKESIANLLKMPDIAEVSYVKFAKLVDSIEDIDDLMALLKETMIASRGSYVNPHLNWKDDIRALIKAERQRADAIERLVQISSQYSKNALKAKTDSNIYLLLEEAEEDYKIAIATGAKKPPVVTKASSVDDKLDHMEITYASMTKEELVAEYKKLYKAKYGQEYGANPFDVETASLRGALKTLRRHEIFRDELKALGKWKDDYIAYTANELKAIVNQELSYLGKSPVGQSAPGKAASDAVTPPKKPYTKKDVVAPYDEDMAKAFGDTFYDDIVKDYKAGKNYSEIANFHGVDIADIDKVITNHLILKHDGDIWKVFLEKPTSHEASKALVEMVNAAKKKGLSAHEIKALTGMDDATYKQITNGLFKPANAGTTTYTPPAGSTNYSTSASGNSSIVVGEVGENFPLASRQQMDDWIQSLGSDMSPEELRAVKGYTGSEYRSINSSLRKGHGAGNATTKQIDATMRPVPEDITLHRGIRSGEGMFGGQDPADLVGTVVSDAGYMSTSFGGSAAFSGRYELIIDVPKGMKARAVHNVSLHKDEREVLLARGTKMIIRGVEKTSSRTKVYLTVVESGV